MNVVVSVAIVTYNHEKFIAQAIESALNQQTDFRYEIVVGDDASSDSTFNICCRYKNEFPDKIKLVRSNTNRGLVWNYLQVLNECSGKYIAILEGDDYWTDRAKLRKQIEILEHDCEVGLVHTDNDQLTREGLIIKSYKKTRGIKPVNGYVYESLLKRNFIASLTVCFRKELFDRYVDFEKFLEEKLTTIDYPLWLELSFHSKVCYINESTAVYRILGTSLTNNRDFDKMEKYYNNGRRMKKYFVEKYGSDYFDNKKVDFQYDSGLLKWAIILKNRNKALEYLGKIKSNKFTFNLLFLLLKINPIFDLSSFIMNNSKRLKLSFR